MLTQTAFVWLLIQDHSIAEGIPIFASWRCYLWAFYFQKSRLLAWSPVLRWLATPLSRPCRELNCREQERHRSTGTGQWSYGRRGFWGQVRTWLELFTASFRHPFTCLAEGSTFGVPVRPHHI